MATTRPTQAFIQSKLEAIAADAAADKLARKMAEKMLRREDTGGTAADPAAITLRARDYLAHDDDKLEPEPTRRALAWLARRRLQLTPTQRQALQARVLALESSSTARIRVRAIARRIAEEFGEIGHDDATIWNRLATALSKTGEDIDAERVERLLKRWRNSVKQEDT